MWEMAVASLHDDVLLDSEECHDQASHCASAYCDSLVGSSDVAQWQHTYRTEWDATDGRNGGAERIVWVTKN